MGIDHLQLLPAHADHAALLVKIDAVDVIHLEVRADADHVADGAFGDQHLADGRTRICPVVADILEAADLLPDLEDRRFQQLV